MNNKYIYLWFVSIILFALSMISLGFFIFVITIPLAIIDLLLLAITSTLYYYSTKKITQPEGYTLIQALFFYLKCKKAGLASSNSFHKRFDEIRKIAKSYDFAKNFTDEEIVQFFISGKKIYKELNNV